MDIPIQFMGEHFIADVDYDVTSYGTPAHYGSFNYPGDPGDPPEFIINSITLRRDTPAERDQVTGNMLHSRAPEFEATGALYDVLSESEFIIQAITEAIYSDGPPEFDDNYF